MFMVAVLTTFGVRSYICNRELKRVAEISGVEFPQFMTESAIMYDYSRRVSEGKAIAGCDKALAGMEHIPLNYQMFLGLEYFLGWGYRMKCAIFGAPDLKKMETSYEDNPDFTKWIMYQLRLWLCLTSGLIFLWLVVLRVPWYFALTGSMLYAVAPAAVARFTGQDLLRGEFCMPFIIACLVLFTWTLLKPRPYKFILFGLAIICSFAFWDAPQMFFMVWGGFELLRILIGGKVNNRRKHLWLTVYIAVGLAAVLVPYHRYHMLVASPLLLVVLPLLLFIMFRAYPRNLIAKWRYSIVAGVVLVLLWRLVSGYTENYGHFLHLMIAKLKFLNLKPINPALLDFDSRILWTPAMHSANEDLTKAFFPFALPFTLFLVPVLLILKRTRRVFFYHFPRLFLPLGFTIGFFVVYVFFVRAHVFCAVFMCVLLPLLLDCLKRSWSKRTTGKRVAAVVVPLLLGLLTVFYEGKKSYQLKREYAGGYFKETAALVKWFRHENIKGVTALADMGVSPVLKAYCGTNIITQPKFELKKPRNIVEEYLNVMFHGSVKEFKAFCDKYGVSLIVFDRGKSSYEMPLHIYSSRYIANARTINRKSPAWLLEKNPGQLKNFYLVNPPKGQGFISATYYVYIYVSDAAMEHALKSAALSSYYLKRGKIDMARRMAKVAYSLAPNLGKTYIAYFNAFGKMPDDALSYLKLKSSK